MTLYTKTCIALFGVSIGVVVVFAADMVMNSGRFIAHAVHSKTPECSGACHGQNAQGSAAVVVLPPMPATHRPTAVTPGPRSSALLGVHVEIKGRD